MYVGICNNIYEKYCALNFIHTPPPILLSTFDYHSKEDFLGGQFLNEIFFSISFHFNFVCFESYIADYARGFCVCLCFCFLLQFIFQLNIQRVSCRTLIVFENKTKNKTRITTRLTRRLSHCEQQMLCNKWHIHCGKVCRLICFVCTYSHLNAIKAIYFKYTYFKITGRT